MITGKAWNDAKTFHPWAYFDPDAERIIPFVWTDWLGPLGIASAYQSHLILTSPELVATSVSVDSGIISVMVQRMPGMVLTPDQDYFVTCRITAANGEVQDKTLFLRIAEQ